MADTIAPEREAVARIIAAGFFTEQDGSVGLALRFKPSKADYAKADAILARGCPEGWVMVPKDDIERSYSDSLLPSPMIYAGMAALDEAETDMANYVSGETTDWDQGMMVVAIYRAMIAAAPQPISGGE